MRKNIAIVLAGGIGSRLGLSTPKQFFKVAGKMVVEHTIDAFESNPHIDEIAIVSNPFYILRAYGESRKSSLYSSRTLPLCLNVSG